MRVNFDAADVQEVRPDTLAFYRYDEAADQWMQLPTSVDWNQGMATANTDHLSIFTFSGVRKVAPVFLPIALQIPYVPPAIPLLNGDFEQGATGWTEASLRGWRVIVNGNEVKGLPTHSGVWSAWMGGDNNEISVIEQAVTVPADRPFLTYYRGIASQDSCGHDFGGVLVDGAVVNVYDLCASNNTPNWVRHVVDLSSYAGQTVALQIRAETNGSLNSNLFVDDVVFSSSGAAVAGDTPVPFRWPSGNPPARPRR